ncbi:MAG: A/G-specific adenine glycosylase [Brachybacterium sp.]|nr:A/G-specific adenine glycosylase [Brachybacterium sp.]
MPDPTRPAHPERHSALSSAQVDAVISWYGENARDLPWRSPEASPWSILVSEIMLQQTPVVRVLPRWQAWMERWPAPSDLAAAPKAEVLRMWDRLGYPRRALRLIECARAIVRDHDGVVPADEVTLRALPGIGEYTAAAIAAFAHGQRAVVADVNIRRVLARAVTGTAQPGASVTATERELTRCTLPVGSERSVRWNQAVMELGALVCTARSPACNACPLAAPAAPGEKGCAWLAAGRPAPLSPRRRQEFTGTDRQLRGQIMALLRARGDAPWEDIVALDPADTARVERCAASLVSDGLAVRDPGGQDLSLP